MKKKILIVAFSFLIAFSPIQVNATGTTPVLATDDANIDTVMENGKASCCYIYVYPYYGSGFVVDESELYFYIATNKHVAIKDKETPMIEFNNGYMVGTECVSMSAENDVAIYRVRKNDIDEMTQKTIKSVILRTDKLSKGEDVGIIGCNEDGSIYTTTGYILDTDTDMYFSGEGYVNTVTATYNSKGGTSGSAVFDNQGYVIGIHKGTSSIGDAIFLSADKVEEELEQINIVNKTMETLIIRE